MAEVKIWILTVVCVVLWDLLKSRFTKKESKTDALLQQIVEEVQELNERMAKYDEKFINVNQNNITINSRLDDHSKRIRDLEKEQHKCRNYEKIE